MLLPQTKWSRHPQNEDHNYSANLRCNEDWTTTNLMYGETKTGQQLI